MKKFLNYALSFIFLLLLTPSLAYAAEFRVSEDNGNVVISEEEKVKNLYAGGNLVSVNADVERGLVVGGNVITIRGDVEGNLMVGGGTVIVRGDVGGTVYVVGGNVIVEGMVGDDLFIGGGTLTIAETAHVGGDLIAGGGVVNIYGPVEGKVLLGAGQATIDSRISGPVMAEVETLSLGKNAEIIGNLSYKSAKEISVTDGAAVFGEVKFDQVAIREKDISPSSYFKAQEPEVLFKMFSVGLLMKLLVSIASALALVYIFKKLIVKVSHESLTRFWPNFGMGFATLVLAPMLALVLVITLFGAWLSGLMMMIYTLMVLLALPLAGISLGSWIMKSWGQSSKYITNWKSAVLGTFAINLIALVPLVGWLASFVFTMVSLGSLSRLLYKEVGRNK